MTPLLSVWVPGTPMPKGSLKHVGEGRMKPDNPGSLPWQEHVAAIAGNAWIERSPVLGGHGPHVGPVALSGAFLFARPPEDTSEYPIGHSGAYDGDKLIRNVADALSAHGSRGAKRCKSACRKHGGVLADDRIIVDWGKFRVRWDTQLIEVTAIGAAEREYVLGGPEFGPGGPGALITVTAL